MSVSSCILITALLSLSAIRESTCNEIVFHFCQTKPTFYHEVVCDNFLSWAEINAEFNQINEQTRIPFAVNIKPLKPIMLTEELDTTSLMRVLNGPSSSANQQFMINLIAIDGINILPWQNGSYQQNINLAFEQSQIKFFVNNTSMEELDCSINLIPQWTRTLFNSVMKIVIGYKNTYSSIPVCPFLFKYSAFETFLILNQIDTILIQNLWHFQPFDEDSWTENEKLEINGLLGININVLQINGYNFRLDTSLMHPLVFTSVQELALGLSIEAIQTDIFKKFSQLKYVYFTMENLKNFFHKIGIDWSQFLSNLTWVAFTNGHITYDYWIDRGDYSYPDRDFCIFAHWPHSSTIIPVFDTLNLTKCTSTLRWLQFNYAKIDMNPVFNWMPNGQLIYSICQESKVWNEIEAKDPSYFEKRVSQCDLSHNRGSTTIYAEYYQVEFITEFIQNLIIFIGIPFACLIGLFLNYTIIWIVNKNKEKDLKDQLYQYMSLNAKFNFAYCLIFLLYPINSCIDTLTNGYFCSSIRTAVVTQYYKIVFLVYFGETIKMCANISYILITVNRYMLIGREHNPILERISKWDMKWIVGGSVCFSLLVNVGHLYQFAINTGRTYEQSPLLGNYYFSIDTYPLINSINYSSGIAVTWYMFGYFLIDFVLFLSVNTFLEIVLLRKLHWELSEKRKRVAQSQTTSAGAQSTNPNTISSVSFRRKRKQDVEKRTEQRAIVMVILNAILNFFLRLPELFFFFSISNFVFGINVLYKIFDSFPRFSLFMTDITYFTYILTFTTNFFIFYLFNMKFKQTFSKWAHVKKRG
jgi:hypothetical protein